MIRKAISKIILKSLGWKTSINVDDKIKRCVMIAAPHTSNWDFFFSLFTSWQYDIKFRFFIKDSYTKKFLLGSVVRKLGGIGVDRSKKNKNLVNYAIELLENSEEMVILVPAEGTREYVEKWKTGFYHIAKGANVPIALGFLNYKDKVSGVLSMLYTSDNMEEDFKKIEDSYKDVPAKHPKLYNKKIFKE